MWFLGSFLLCVFIPVGIPEFFAIHVWVLVGFSTVFTLSWESFPVHATGFARP